MADALQAPLLWMPLAPLLASVVGWALYRNARGFAAMRLSAVMSGLPSIDDLNNDVSDCFLDKRTRTFPRGLASRSFNSRVDTGRSRRLAAPRKARNRDRRRHRPPPPAAPA